MSDGKLRALIEEMRAGLAEVSGILSNMTSNGYITTDAHSTGYREYFVPTSVFENISRLRSAADSHLSASSSEGWRDIASAPKDGARFLAYRKDGEVDFFHWQDQGRPEAPVGWRDSFIMVYREDDPDGPQGWMPLPPPPSPGDEQTPQSMEQGR